MDQAKISMDPAEIIGQFEEINHLARTIAVCAQPALLARARACVLVHRATIGTLGLAL